MTGPGSVRQIWHIERVGQRAPGAICPGGFVAAAAGDLLGRKRRGLLLERAAEGAEGGFNLAARGNGRRRALAGRQSLGIVRVRRLAESDDGFVAFRASRS